MTDNEEKYQTTEKDTEITEKIELADKILE